MFAKLVLALLLVSSTLQLRDHLLVETKLGQVQGFFDKETEVNKWLGVRYAKAPLKEKRFRSSEKVEPWEGVYDATKFGPNCWGSQDHGPFKWENNTMSEDCLYLNIFAPPNLPENSSLPVMIWIHGGAFEFGGSSFKIYHGDYVVKNDVIVVSINYRLGPLGFMVRDELGTGGVNGLGDQINALEFLIDNIQFFGGNPNKITIFGESAGSLSGCALSSSPKTVGKIFAVIMESGPCIIQWAPQSPENGLDQMDNFLFTLEVDSLDDLIDWEAKELAAWPWPDFPHGNAWWGDELYPESTFDRFQNPANIHVDNYIIGDNSLDGILSYLTKVIPTTEQKYLFLFEQYFGDSIAPLMAKRYPFDKFKEGGIPIAAIEATGDHDVVCANRYLARILANYTKNVYTYQYQNYFPCLENIANNNYTRDSIDLNNERYSTHASEIYFIFNQTQYNNNTQQNCVFTQDEINFSQNIMKYWTNFAKTGNPNSEGLYPWKPFKLEDQSSMIFGPAETRYRNVEFHKEGDCDFMDLVYAEQGHIPWPSGVNGLLGKTKANK